MCVVNKPKIILKKANGFHDSSYYHPSTNEIVVLNDSCKLGSLYHEYRHYIQFKFLPTWFLIWAALGRALMYPYLTFVIICIVFELTSFLNIISVIDLILIFPALLMEIDANIFSIKRTYNKKVFLVNIWGNLFSLTSYIFSYFIFQIICAFISL